MLQSLVQGDHVTESRVHSDHVTESRVHSDLATRALELGGSRSHRRSAAITRTVEETVQWYDDPFKGEHNWTLSSSEPED